MDSRDRDPGAEEIRELVDLHVDGGLATEEAAALAARLAADVELRHEQRDLERLQALLAADRVTARPGFAAAVMASLPAQPDWGRAPLAGWKVATAALAALLALTVGLLALGGGHASAGSPAMPLARALGEFAAATALSGSGLLAASWRGVGMAVAAALTLPGRVVFGIGVVALNGLLVLLLRRPRRRARALAHARRGR